LDLALLAATIDGYLHLDWAKLVSMAFVLIVTLVALRLLRMAVHGVVADHPGSRQGARQGGRSEG